MFTTGSPCTLRGVIVHSLHKWLFSLLCRLIFLCDLIDQRSICCSLIVCFSLIGMCFLFSQDSDVADADVALFRDCFPMTRWDDHFVIRSGSFLFLDTVFRFVEVPGGVFPYVYMTICGDLISHICMTICESTSYIIFPSYDICMTICSSDHWIWTCV